MLRFTAAALTATLLAACYVETVPPSESRVWSTANSQDGYAACPSGTVVTGGGFEMKETDRTAGHVPLVVASRPDGNGWRVICTDPEGKWSPACRAWAVCASVLAH
jgi:hypothetical protein